VYGDEVVYVAAPGERNDVTLQAVDLGGMSGTWEVRDPGATISATGPCRAIDEHTAQCVMQGFANPIGGYRVRLGDGDDTLRVASPTASFVSRVVADGGPGDDELFGGNSDYLFGDSLSGGGGRDRLHGGAGPDQLSDGDLSRGAGSGRAPDRDVLDGGAGVDTVSYRQRTASVRVDLADGSSDGERGERDLLTSIESIVGGQGSDRLAGDAAANSINGQRGHDRLIGRGGADDLTSGAATACGGGEDTVHTASSFYGRDTHLGLLERDCERIDPAWQQLLAAYPDRVTGRAVIYRLDCPVDEGEGEVVACGGRLEIREHTRSHRLLAQGRLARRGSVTRRLVARYTARGRRLVLGGRSVMADVTVTDPGLPASAHWTIRIVLGR
jgi:hypothetical protein